MGFWEVWAYDNYLTVQGRGYTEKIIRLVDTHPAILLDSLS